MTREEAADALTWAPLRWPAGVAMRVGMDQVFGLVRYNVPAGSSSHITDTMRCGLGLVLDPPAGAASRLEGQAP